MPNGTCLACCHRRSHLKLWCGMVLGCVMLSFLLSVPVITGQISDRSLVGTSSDFGVEPTSIPLRPLTAGARDISGPRCSRCFPLEPRRPMQPVVIYGSFLSAFPRSLIFCLTRTRSRVPGRCKISWTNPASRCPRPPAPSRTTTPGRALPSNLLQIGGALHGSSRCS
jgi:hypothetical protein